jgi:hypothetical protein
VERVRLQQGWTGMLNQSERSQRAVAEAAGIWNAATFFALPFSCFRRVGGGCPRYLLLVVRRTLCHSCFIILAILVLLLHDPFHNTTNDDSTPETHSFLDRQRHHLNCDDMQACTAPRRGRSPPICRHGC